ncbi:putative bifunctional diguanylate cyclase/phosphodiesterase [Halochromatium glycolicum]|uniref:Diguanylate cyclase (GGDEF) domain-containing protein n=1 Tax=Halochromatium glycolicum TaxID=85075 RepID=A0AAJ0U1X4_9GAMM|nr:EAL domain-containing protein [Halochromatium glycolicum]MBK1703766.1 hypothetical protein [Halochromatium glycolicum]
MSDLKQRLCSSQADHRPFLGLRWKVLIGISLTLAAVIISLTLYAHAILIDQFERDQADLRHRQAEHFTALIADRYQQMARLASMVPRLASVSDKATIFDHLSEALQLDGSMLDLEWDIRSVHWLPIDGEPLALWPPEARTLPSLLVREIEQQPEQITQQLLCDQDACRQFLASPVLWQGETAGSLVLGRSMASILLAFSELTEADLAIAAIDERDDAETASTESPFNFVGATQPQQVLPVLQSVPAASLLATDPSYPLAIEFNEHWYEVFRNDPNGVGLVSFVINQTTDDRHAIRQMSRNSLLIGLLGLLMAELLLLLTMQGPVTRIRRLSQLLPLLAENRFDTLADQLPPARARTGLRDEIDETITVTNTLNQRMARMQEEREAARQELLWLADHDPLTALLNRRRFDHELAQAVSRAQEHGRHGALLFIDLDHFKDVNDTSGHQAGDRLLKRMAKRLVASLSEHDKVGRFGGDEFAVLLNDTEPDEIARIAERLQEQISSTSVRAGTHRHQVSASIGIAVFPDHGVDTQTLMANADLAMYQAKSGQRRRYHFYSEDDSARAQANARVIWSREITEALSSSRLQLYYQPIMELPERRVWRAEGLLRIRLTDGRIAAPNEFIPIAERTGLISAIDRWVMAEAIRLLQQQPHLSLSINLSAKALGDISLNSDIARLIEVARIDPKRLTLEITETIAIDNISSAVARIESVRALGCRFALDDFGSGFASYAYLKQLPVEAVKIDGSFIRALDRNLEDRIFVRAVTEMAHATDKKVVAEFVESEAILKVLCDLGVDFAQGYFIGRPVPEPPAAESWRLG